MSDIVNQAQNKFKNLREKHSTRYIILIVASLLVIFPLFWMVSTSLKTRSALLGFPPSLIPANPVLRPYFDAFQTGAWGRWFLNTTIVAVGATIGVLIIATPAAYVLSRRDFPGSNVLYVTFIGTMILPPQILLIPLYSLFSRFGLVNNWLGLIFVYLVLYGGFATFILYNFFKTLPENIEDAARIAGISEWKTFLYVVLPQALPGIGSAAIFVFVFAWNEFLFALTFMQKQSMYTISVGLMTFQTQYGTVIYNRLMAMSTLATIPVLLLFVLMQDKFIKGITTEF